MRYKASTLRIIEKLKELYPEGLERFPTIWRISPPSPAWDGKPPI